jgi:hypothetical protein
MTEDVRRSRAWHRARPIFDKDFRQRRRKIVVVCSGDRAFLMKVLFRRPQERAVRAHVSKLPVDGFGLPQDLLPRRRHEKNVDHSRSCAGDNKSRRAGANNELRGFGGAKRPKFRRGNCGSTGEQERTVRQAGRHHGRLRRGREPAEPGRPGHVEHKGFAGEQEWAAGQAAGSQVTIPLRGRRGA